MPQSADAEVLASTRRWIAEVVIGLNLCPFAQAVFQGNRIRYVVTPARAALDLHDALAAELQLLAAAPLAEIETTLLIHPHALVDFAAYNDFLGDGDRLIGALRLRGVIQLASFHPDYRFADADAAAAENYTNRSPFPMLHLLREQSISALNADPEALRAIPERNRALLRRLGVDRMRATLAAIREG